MADSDFDPRTVPPFPVFRLDVTAGEPVAFNGVSLGVDEDHGGLDHAIEAAAAEARDRGLDAVRMHGTYHGAEHSFVVTAEGESYDLDDDPDNKPAGPSTRKKVLIAFISAAIVGTLLVTAIFVGVKLTQREETPEAGPPPIPGAGAQVPIALPKEYKQQADWSVTVRDGARATVLSDGGVLTTDPSANLVVLDPDRGTPTWRGTKAPQDTRFVLETSWAGRPVLAAKVGNQLRLWARDLPGEGAVSPVDIDLPNQATVTYAGDSPLVDLGDYTVGVPGPDDELQRVSIPVGTTPTNRDQNTIISIGHDAIMSTNTDTGKQTKAAGLIRPPGAEGELQQAIGVGPGKALVLWRTKEGTTAVYLDTTTGRRLGEVKTAGTINARTAQLNPAAHTALVADLFITTGDTPAIAQLNSSGSPVLAGAAVYSRSTEGASVYRLVGEKIQDSTWPTFRADDPLPAAENGRALWVVAQQVDHDVLYRTTRISTPTTQSPDPTN